MVSIYDKTGVEAVRKRLRLDPQMIRRVRGTFLRTFRGAESALAELPESARAEFAAAVRFHDLEPAAARHSKLDGASKLLLRTDDGCAIESVILRIKTGRTALCVSTQTGCAGGCLFCATGRLKGVRNLTVPEILDQVARAGERLRGEGRTLRNVVFMGMGEPFHNEANVCAALEELWSREGFHLSDRHLLVSTLGIPDAMRRLAARFPRVGLAVSLHSVRQEVRDQLMPLTRRWPLPELRAAIAGLNAVQDHPVMIEYLMLGGLTDTDADLARLMEWLAGLRVHVNLIPYNHPTDWSDQAYADAPLELRASPDARVTEFLAALKRAGFTATRRHSLGSDIAAACGQLARRAAAEDSEGRSGQG
jgi:23S rRNA (adenine2503-C2)-methyltransferase